MDQSVYIRIKKGGMHGNHKNYPTTQLGDQFKAGKLTGVGTLVPFSLLNGTKSKWMVKFSFLNLTQLSISVAFANQSQLK